ncbi:MAG TPA: hypothetical protein VE046_08080 [Steroidobacteraceae bacterium]|nr:hypothetical protein [Steroidobacteraceae bacterium]
MRMLTDVLKAHAGLFASLLLLGGCMVQEERPQPKLAPVQPVAEIPQTQVLDVGVRLFDPGVPADVMTDVEQQVKQGIFPDLRKAESRYLAMNLRNTLEASGQWGAVRVIPDMAQFVDVIVMAKIVESNGKYLKLDVSAMDATGRKWIDHKRYEQVADIASYHDAPTAKPRDPFQNLYVHIADDLLAARQKVSVADLENVRRVASLRFAADLAPDPYKAYLASSHKAQYSVARLPAADDPMFTRIDGIRQRDFALIDTVSDYYSGFSDAIGESYSAWRRDSYDDITEYEKLKSQATTRTALGAAAILAAIFVPSQCSNYDYNCQRIESAVRSVAAVGGTAGILSGLKKRSDAKLKADSIRELATSFQSEVAPQVIEVEGRTLRLTGTAEDQYEEWRKLLRSLYAEETGGVVATPVSTTQPAAAAEGVAPTKN